MSGLPRILDEIAGAAGEEAALAFAAAFGGRTIYVPAVIGAHHPWAVLLGHEQAQAVAGALGPGERHRVPFGATGSRAQRQALVRALKAEGLSVPAIAARLRIDQRSVQRELGRAAKGPGPQGDLFG